MRAVRHDCAEIAARRGVAITEELVNADEPAQSAAHIVKVLEKVCGELGVAAKKMVSRAYHDSLFMARVAPIAMVFIPCRGGVSHRPDEYAATGDIALGAHVLALALARLASE
jgi:N-carbamoyl-L-amino-acid hydrolase